MDGKTILIVDDEPHIRYMLELKLSNEGFMVLTASNGRQAYDLACQDHPDLVISDYQMPGADGLELCLRLRANPETSGIPALMLTARGYKIPPSDLAKTNIRRVMDKPFSPQELIAEVHELLKAAPSADGSLGERGASAA